MTTNDTIIEDHSYGIIPVFKKDNELFFLLVRSSKTGNWFFPKGHREGNETDIAAAERELQEETGLSEVLIKESPKYVNEYSFEREGKKYHRTLTFFVGITSSQTVIPQPSEIRDCQWFPFEQALATISFDDARDMFKEAFEYIKSNI